jgi:hypothetical protein
MDATVLESVRTAFGFANAAPSIVLGAPLHAGAVHAEPLVRIPLAMLNRHGLIAGATGTGKTKTLQLIAEQLSAQGVPVFLVDVKGDLSGLGAAGDAGERVTARATEVGHDWRPAAFPIELLSLTGAKGAQLRATVSSFGPQLLAKVLDLNDTQASVLALVFKYADDHGLLLLDFSDLRAVLQYLTEDGAAELKAYGGISKQSVGVLLRKMVTLESDGAGAFFGEPEFDLDDLFQVERDGRGLVSCLELADVQDKPRLWSTFVLWLLATLYNELPEVGDVEKPKLVFFFDEAHLLFDDASAALRDQVEQVARLIRSKGVGVFFVTQSPKDIPAPVVGQLGHRVQHALRAFTEDDARALRAAARTFPKTPHYDLEETLTTLGIGEALVTVLGARGVPTPPVATRLIPPASRMAPLTDAEVAPRLQTPQVRKYATAIDRESARERLAARAAATDAPESVPESEAPPPAPAPRRGPFREAGYDPTGGAPIGRRAAREPQSDVAKIAKSVGTSALRSMVVIATGALTRGVLGALTGKQPRRRR